MKHYLIHFFLLISFLLIFGACSLTSHSGFSKIPQSTTGDFRILDDEFEKVLFQASIDVYENHLSGLMFVKDMIVDSSYRVVFLSETGLSFFDFEFPKSSNQPFKVHYCMDMLNKKLIIKTLKQDIELLLMTGLDNSKLKSFKDKSDEFYVRKYKDGRDYDFK